ncbi:hypothetical protein D9756_004595 [Leucocoprinus leucothites]|uniref:Cytochrome P450 n=1 Tax=Leucocoprinus leucothites TaxID=201217 RepID=A0A8H5G9A9_9AGAR|nr:hypothetical protein D9756_004595 [Leucoagaricus leucothites]
MLDLSTGGILCILATIVIVFYRSREQLSRRGLPLPPGPKPLPLVGNLFDQPQENPWLTYHQWGKEHASDILSFRVLGRPTIILNSVKVISDLLEKRSTIYSDRVRAPMLNELIGWNWNFCFMPYGQRWRERRRVFTRHFSPSALQWLHPVHTQHSRILLRHLLSSPNEFRAHLRQNQTATIMESVYGMEIKDQHDPFYDIAEISMLSLSKAGIIGTFYVDFLPSLSHIPSWFPGAGFQSLAVEWGKYVRALRDDGFMKLREKMKQNTARPCIAKTMLDNVNLEDEKAVEIARDALGIAFGAGADTSLATNLVFFLAMALYPESQHKAQAEIDQVVGRDRLPEFNDRPNLPYVNALCKEVLRWQSVTPLSVFHATSQDDVYDGYFIPKGSVIVANTWAITRDLQAYPEPEKFNPDRFLKDGKIDPNVRDPQAHIFGSGRRSVLNPSKANSTTVLIQFCSARICPGRYFALDSLYSAVTNVLACFTIEPHNHEKLPEPRMTDGVISFPESYNVLIKPRYKEVEALIESAVVDI